MAPSAPKKLPRGIYTPLPTFFLPQTQDLDLPSFTSHLTFTALAGTYPVIAGTAGEAAHLSSSDRSTLIRTARETLLSLSLAHIPIIAGVGAPSTRETIALAKDAAAAGADFGMVIPPGIYAGPLMAQDGRALKKYFLDVAEHSPLPVIVYNFPAVSGGVDLSAEFVVDVVRGSGNVVGGKFTCANVGKITRITAIAHDPSFKSQYPRNAPHEKFEVVDGYIDILLPTVSVGAAGAISGLPNFAPRTCVKLWQLCQDSPHSKAALSEAVKLQGLIALVDGFAVKIGIAGMKGLLHRLFGYGKEPRSPLLPMEDVEIDEIMENEYVKQLLAYEGELALEEK